jgi:serine/threonine protein kinase
MADNTEAPGGPTKVDFVALKPGSVVGRYEILAVLGQGGFGITYRARDSQLGREVALKEFLPTSLAVRQDGTTVMPRSTDVASDFVWGRDRFVAEGRTLATLHEAPAIVRVFDFLETNGTAYIVMELVRGETLEKRLERGPLGPAELDAILWPLLDGLEQVHASGFLHRDIKPGNILLSPQGKPILIDFGASRAAIAGRSTAMTAIFTLGYAAPEQMSSAKQGPWTDIYGLAATFYRALSGVTPPSAFDRMLDDEYKPLATLAPRNLSPSLLQAIDAGLAVRASERPQSIAEWRSLLTGSARGDATAMMPAARATPAPLTEVTPASPSRSQSAPPAPASEAASLPPQQPAAAPTGSAVPAAAKSRTPLYAGAAVVLLLLLGGGGWLASRPSAPASGPVASVVPPPSAPVAAAGSTTGPTTGPTTGNVQEMKVEELERVLAERRRADAEVAQKRQLEEEAKRKAAAEAQQRTDADAEVARAQAERQKAEAELARLREQLEAEKKAAAQREASDARARREAAEEAARKIESEMAALRQTEEAARRKAAVDAEEQRKAEAALALAHRERKQVQADAKAKAELEARQKEKAGAQELAEAQARDKEAKAKAEADKKAAETTEASLRLSLADRQHVQVALTALGFNTSGSDGAFGPRTREMIGNWQKSRSQNVTGFLTGAQSQDLQQAAAPAIAKFDADQKKLEEDKKKAEEEAKAKAAAAPPPAPVQAAPATPTPPPQTASAAPPSAPAAGAIHGVFTGGANAPDNLGVPLRPILRITLTVNGSSGSVRIDVSGTSFQPPSTTIAVAVAADGAFSGAGTFTTPVGVATKVSVTGQVTSTSSTVKLTGLSGPFSATLTRAQ